MTYVCMLTIGMLIVSVPKWFVFRRLVEYPSKEVIPKKTPDRSVWLVF